MSQRYDDVDFTSKHRIFKGQIMSKRYDVDYKSFVVM